ncbi:MAG: hypothetical protein IJS52_03625 [Bacilli bacterium]|nr:hypothetical protein [Bacilli bacterium]
MNIAIRYLSKLGHTKDIAVAIGEALNVPAVSILDEPSLSEQVDILFLGGAPYANIMDGHLREYAKSLNKESVGKVILFTTSNWSRRTVRALKKILMAKGIQVASSFFYAHMLRIEKGKERAKRWAKEMIKKQA